MTDLTPNQGLYFEDFRVGQSFGSPIRQITQDDLDAFIALSGDGGRIHRDAAYAQENGFAGPVVHGPFGVAVTFGLLFEQRIVEPTAIAMLDLDWQFLAPIVVGDQLSSTMTITRCRRSSTRQAGIVGRHFSLRNGTGSVVQEGTSALLVQAREEPSAQSWVATDFCSAAWADLLVPLLVGSAGFQEATASFDGGIGLACGREVVQFRIYKGQIIDVGRSTPTAARFTLAGTELAWAGLARASRNDFIARTSRGDFNVSGNAYDYLRMTKALVFLWDAVRELAATDGGA
jgi:acyl dehydratase